MPLEFKELRKQWRKAKKEEGEARVLDVGGHGSHQTQHSSQHHTSPHSMSSVEYPTHDVYAHHPTRSIEPQTMGSLDDLAHQRDVYSHRSQRYSSFVPPHPQHSGIAYPHTHAQGPHASVNRLPANSTLLMPISGYEPTSIGSAPDFDPYHLYRSDSRPRSGHGSPASHVDRGRPRSSHANLGSGHSRDRP